MKKVGLVEVDRLEVRNLMDNFTDILMAGSEGVERSPFGKNEEMRPAPLAEHGFSILVKVTKGNIEHSILVDTGVTADGILVNADRMEIDLNQVESIVITHGHVDHTAGLMNVLKRLSKKYIPVVFHQSAFVKRWTIFPNGSRVRLPGLDKQELIDAGAKIIEITEPYLMAENLMLVSGEIPRVTDFEKGLPISYVEVEGKLEKDPQIKDDMSIAFNVKGKGLVIISGCAHAGIINTMKYLKELTDTKIHAVMGGFHLTGKAFEPIIDRTIAELKKFEPSMIVPSHCTGWKAINKIYQEMPESYVQNAVGTKYTF